MSIKNTARNLLHIIGIPYYMQKPRYPFIGIAINMISGVVSVQGNDNLISIHFHLSSPKMATLSQKIQN